MRADRLISLLLLLQTRGQMTASELASELDVSVRTIYRDVDALSAAGIPVYAERGPGGGCTLLDGYRTTLDGFTPEELAWLQALRLPGPLADLQLADAARSAILKLQSALSTQAPQGQPIDQRLLLDWGAWEQRTEARPHLATLQQAIREVRRVEIGLSMRSGTHVGLRLAPLGLVASGANWFLVAQRDGRPRTIDVARVIQVTLLAEGYERPPGFDLEAYWREHCQRLEETPQYEVALRLSATLREQLPMFLRGQGQVSSLSEPGHDGWVDARIVFRNLIQARSVILGWGAAARVLTPDALRTSLLDVARQIVAAHDA